MLCKLLDESLAKEWPHSMSEPPNGIPHSMPSAMLCKAPQIGGVCHSMP